MWATVSEQARLIPLRIFGLIASDSMQARSRIHRQVMMCGSLFLSNLNSHGYKLLSSKQILKRV